MRTDPTSYVHWKNSHICKYNYKGSAGGMQKRCRKKDKLYENEEKLYEAGGF